MYIYIHISVLLLYTVVLSRLVLFVVMLSSTTFSIFFLVVVELSGSLSLKGQGLPGPFLYERNGDPKWQ